MKRMTSQEIWKLLDIVIGPTEPVADSTIDVEREENLKTLIDIGNWVLDGLYHAAKHRKEPYYSSSKVGERAYGAMLEWKDWLTESAERYGRWIFDIDNKGWSWDKPYMCDQCGEWNGKETPYCPNCGARMSGEQEKRQ